MLRRLRLIVGRHLAVAQTHDDFVPAFPIVDQCLGGRERLEVQALFLFLLAVAGETVLGKKRFDDRVEAGARRGCQQRRPAGDGRGRKSLFLGGSNDRQGKNQRGGQRYTQRRSCASPV